MIIKILEEMRQIRLKEDYNNYRTLSDVLNNYLYVEIYNVPTRKISEELYDKIIIILKWVDSEITHIDKIINSLLKDKKYKDFKFTSQSYNSLQKIKNKLDDIKFYYNKNANNKIICDPSGITLYKNDNGKESEYLLDQEQFNKICKIKPEWIKEVLQVNF